MILFWIVVLIGAVWLISALLKKAADRSDKSTRRDSPLDTLKQRYAAGEITKNEFEQRKHDIPAP